MQEEKDHFEAALQEERERKQLAEANLAKELLKQREISEKEKNWNLLEEGNYIFAHSLFDLHDHDSYLTFYLPGKFFSFFHCLGYREKLKNVSTEIDVLKSEFDTYKEKVGNDAAAQTKEVNSI